MLCTLIGGAILTLALAIALPHPFCGLVTGPMLAAFIAAIVAVAEWVIRRRAPQFPFRLAAIGLTVVLTLALGARFIYETRPPYMFREMIADPIPASVRDITAEEAPTFSDGSIFYFRFLAAPSDIDSIAHRLSLVEESTEDAERFEYPASFEQRLSHWPPYRRPPNRRVARNTKITLVYDTTAGVTFVAIDQMSDPTSRR